MADHMTVVIIALVEGAALAACIEGARAEADQLMVVARDGSVRDAEGYEIGRSRRTDVPARRQAAASIAETPLIGFLEDTVNPVRGWGDAARSTLAQTGVGAAGGPVSIDRHLPSASRALALTEYGRFRSFEGRDAVPAIPGCNFAFRREALLAACSGEGLIDNEVFDQLRVSGLSLAWVPGMSATFCAAHAQGARLTTRFEHGRLYSGRRLSQSGPGARLAGAAKALALAPVLVARTLSQADVTELRSAPTVGQVALQHGAWAIGELAGALFGPRPGGTAVWQ